MLSGLTACAGTSPTLSDDISLLEAQVASYVSQDKYEEAEPLARRALDIAENRLGPEHPLVALELNALAYLYKQQGKYKNAEPLLRRSLALIEQQAAGEWKHWWVIHPARRAAPLVNLAEVYSKQGRHDEAEPLLQRALDIFESASGPSASEVVYVVNQLASLNMARGKYPEAKSQYERILEIMEKAKWGEWGQGHKVAETLENLAALYKKIGRDAEAEKALERARAIREKR